jgi:glutamate/tyrosine decarboxylase-like PLP-dependent enzyme
MKGTIWDRALMSEAFERAHAFLEALPERDVAPPSSAVERLEAGLAGPIPSVSTPPVDVLVELDRLASPATVASAGPRFFGFVHGGALPVSLAASWLATAWDQNAFSTISSPAGTRLEETVLRWLQDLFGLPDGTAGALTTGATLANFTALAAARHRLLARAGWDVERDGLFGAPAIPVYVSEESHPTVRKALALLGLGRDRVETLATDDQGRIRADALEAIAPGSLVCAQAGNVNSGAFDPFPVLSDACRRRDAWLHVDGAFGLWALASREKRALAEGVALADSWVTDGHKWLNVPYDCGIVFVRDAEALRNAMSIAAAYLPADGAREPFHYTPEASRRARGVEAWAVLRSLGREGVEALVDRCCGHARRFAEGLAEAGHEILNEVVLNQVVVSFGDDDANARVIGAIQREGVCWCGPTQWRGRAAMRISVSCWATGEDDVERSLDSILRAARAEGGALPAATAPAA